ncbi:MgtC/SapB family protein [Massilia sp. TS11]|uniref:MgtC/SapB family protein n=1 Tax=Massilia sp. TS11 TaxID=2908003 RepID=UPI001EDAF7BB|nr:MgtC/SapB family protein [Massilia sp. TS11]MCG2585284.1 MgtC/SapB family protein [Massilia sp. TS11]
MPTIETLTTYWSERELFANTIIVMNLLGALSLGLLVGYERSYHGRAAGMRTYGLVCMASCALTIIAGFPGMWFGGGLPASAAADPTRIIQGIVTGIGFLGTGVIMREGFNISGLSTAASLWAASVIGVLVGLNFYLAAISLACASAIAMIGLPSLEVMLPRRHAVAIMIRFGHGVIPDEAQMRAFALDHGYEIALGSLNISADGKQQEWRFVCQALSRHHCATLSELGNALRLLEGVDGYQVAHARN